MELIGLIWLKTAHSIKLAQKDPLVIGSKRARIHLQGSLELNENRRALLQWFMEDEQGSKQLIKSYRLKRAHQSLGLKGLKDIYWVQKRSLVVEPIRKAFTRVQTSKAQHFLFPIFSPEFESFHKIFRLRGKKNLRKKGTRTNCRENKLCSHFFVDF